MLRDEFGDSLGCNPRPRKVHLALTASLDGVPVHTGLVVCFWSFYCRREVLVIMWKVLHDAYHHVLVHSLSSLSVFLSFGDSL